ncbi:MAG: STAS domain-containing protein [Alphaproteobacteria bacterium]|nr:STAS domain-containing protein [Alphaproteobacteria bacterium]
MKFSAQETATGKQIVLSGRITFADFDAIKSVIALVQECNGHRVELDLSAVEFIDSSALGMFMLVRDAARSKNIGLTFKSAKGQVKRIMNLASFQMAA